MSDWLMFQGAVDIVRDHLGGAVGRAEAVVKAARTSGEVRFNDPARPVPVLLLPDDGMVGMMRPGAQGVAGIASDGKPTLHRPGATNSDCISKDDLLDWLSRTHQEAKAAVASVRYPGDAALIEEGRQMILGGKHKRAVARELAERAEGAGTLESKVDRLRRLL